MADFNLQKGCLDLTRREICTISLLKKALSEVDIVHRVSRKAQRAFSDYFKSSLAGEAVDA